MRNLKLTVNQYNKIKELVKWEKEQWLGVWEEEGYTDTIKIYRQLFSKFNLEWEESE